MRVVLFPKKSASRKEVTYPSQQNIMLTAAIALVSLTFPLLGVGAQFPSSIPSALTSFPSWGLQRDAIPRPYFYDSWRQQDPTRQLAASTDKLVNYMNYATPSSDSARNYKTPFSPRYYDRPREEYEQYLYNQNRWNAQNVLRYPYMYDGFRNPYNRGVIESAAAALGITIPIEINVRDTFDAFIKYLQSLGIIRAPVTPTTPNMYLTTESYIPDALYNDYVKRPASDISTPTTFIQFNVFQLGGLKVPGSRPEYGDYALPMPVQGDPYTHMSSAAHAPGMVNSVQADPNRRRIEAPLPYWIYNRY